MKHSIYNWLKINHYGSIIQDVEVQIPNNNPREKRIMKFLIKEYKRRIKFIKELDKLEKR